VGQTLEATLLTPNIPFMGYERIYYLLSRPPKNRKQYKITINDYPDCSCVDFFSMMASSLSKRGRWVAYKHLYYILQYAMYFGIR